VQLTDVGFLSHLLAAFGFTALAVSVIAQRTANTGNIWLVVAALATAAWAGDFILAARFGGRYITLLSPAETLRTSAWIAFLVALLRTSWRRDGRGSSSLAIAAAIGFVASVQIGLDFVDMVGSSVTSLHTHPLIAAVFVVSRLTVAISGLVLLHNLYVNADPGSRAGIRLLCIGLAGFFGYDLNLYTLEFLLGSGSDDLVNIRGAVDVLTVPLLLLSARQAWVARVQVSRQVVFNTVSMSIIGGYLIAMSVLAYGLRLVGGDWGRLLQITFLFATAILGAVVALLPRVRAMLRVQIAKNFFAYRYDYRVEWLRFINTVSGIDAAAGGLPERVVEAVATVVDSPGGALFAPGEDGRFDMIAKWNWRGFTGATVGADSDLPAYLAGRQRIVDLDEVRSGTGDYNGLAVPEWAASDRGTWLIVPLLHLRGALTNLSARVRTQDIQMFVVSVSIQAETGGSLADILDGLSRVIRERASMAMKVRALSSEGKMTGTVLSLLPVATFCFVFATSPEFYFGVMDDPLFLPGFMMVGIWYATGIIIMKKLIKIKI
jgi:putative PEP-CTERM system histidine kinase